MSGAIRKKDRKWLEMVRDWTQNPAGMYPGVRCRDLPDGPTSRLRKAGLIESYWPHNQAHDDRWTLTEKGEAALTQRQEDK